MNRPFERNHPCMFFLSKPRRHSGRKSSSAIAKRVGAACSCRHHCRQHYRVLQDFLRLPFPIRMEAAEGRSNQGCNNGIYEEKHVVATVENFVGALRPSGSTFTANDIGLLSEHATSTSSSKSAAAEGGSLVCHILYKEVP